MYLQSGSCAIMVKPDQCINLPEFWFFHAGIMNLNRLLVDSHVKTIGRNIYNRSGKFCVLSCILRRITQKLVAGWRIKALLEVKISRQKKKYGKHNKVKNSIKWSFCHFLFLNYFRLRYRYYESAAFFFVCSFLPHYFISEVPCKD